MKGSSKNLSKKYGEAAVISILTIPKYFAVDSFDFIVTLFESKLLSKTDVKTPKSFLLEHDTSI
jgi:hypothetical protein